MLHLLLLLSSSAAAADDDKHPTIMPPSPRSTTSLCNHSPSATLDLLILVLVLFSGAFLLSSYFSYLFHSLSLLSLHFPSLDLSQIPPASFLFAFAVFFAASVAFLDLCCGARSRKCRNPKCKGLKKAMEFDLQLQNEECVKSGSGKEIERLPWKGGTESNPDYECLRAELRRMAPLNGRAVLLFRSRCGCPVAKLVGWGPKRARRHKKSQANLALKGGVDNRCSGR